MSEFIFYWKICISDNNKWNGKGDQPGVLNKPYLSGIRSVPFPWAETCRVFVLYTARSLLSSSYYRIVLFKVVLVTGVRIVASVTVRLISAFSIDSLLHNRNWRQKSLDVRWLKSIGTGVSGMMAAAENLHWDLQTAGLWDQLWPRAGVNENCYHLFSLK